MYSIYSVAQGQCVGEIDDRLAGAFFYYQRGSGPVIKGACLADYGQIMKRAGHVRYVFGMVTPQGENDDTGGSLEVIGPAPTEGNSLVHDSESWKSYADIEMEVLRSVQ